MHGKLVLWALSVQWEHVDFPVGLCVPTCDLIVCLEIPVPLESRAMSMTSPPYFPSKRSNASLLDV